MGASSGVLADSFWPDSPLACCMFKQQPHEVVYLKALSHKVQLAASLLGGIPGLMAHHTSVVVDGEEFFFSPRGIQRSWGPDFESHRRMGTNGELITPLKNGGDKHSIKVVDIGSCIATGNMLVHELAPHFQGNTYDLLHKNCNTFSDIALYYLTGKRLDSQYNSIEKVGANNPSLLTNMTGGAYTPNPSSVDFDAQKLCQSFAELLQERGTCGPKGIGTSTVVRVKKLQSEQAQLLNGKAGVVQRFQAKNGRFEVRVGTELKALRPENVEPFVLEQEYLLVGLQSEAARALNGQRCQVVSFVPQSDRIEVELFNGGERKAVKAENLAVCLPEEN
eukprot:TRINITY_DN28671_c0_g1_i1.p1 TRINITY_DN28671_c0_g1~~TRINITY_DN28671_c0_g1_i1.p1  ORF type:complete len:335 (+),score=74.21 TRINITY_DN28671_c0_g1_i1:360-1364(+)